MQISAIWKDCDYFGRPAKTAYWIGVEEEDLVRVLQHSRNPEALQAEIKLHRRPPHTRFYLLVSQDLDSIISLHMEYPYSSLWNAYNPFIAVGPVEIESLGD